MTKLDIVVVLSMVVVMVVGGLVYMWLQPAVVPQAVIGSLGEQIQEGMSLGQVWDMWGVPDKVEFNAEYHLADYQWFNPFRHVLFATDPDVWVVISHWGYTGLLAP